MLFLYRFPSRWPVSLILLFLLQYSYADIITIHPDHLPEFEKKIAMFFEEHIHDAEEIRYILGGSGFFDVRNLQDQWVRIHVKQGDLMTLPEGTWDWIGRGECLKVFESTCGFLLLLWHVSSQEDSPGGGSCFVGCDL